MFRFNNRAPVAIGGSDVVGSATRHIDDTLLPPHLFPPRGSTMLFKSDATQTTGAGIYIPAGLKFVVPKGQLGILRVLSPFVDGPTATTVLTWTVRVNGVSASGLNGLTIIGRDAASIEKIFDQWSIELPELASVDVQIQQTDGGAYRVGMQLEGWTYNAETVFTR